ncbi:hypothetical protein PLCT2_02114 [Planctomycetaceae bacterium]|nr:hypothetical protein PLCT2_02114 [Planctomycetaceae bacterium]
MKKFRKDSTSPPAQVLHWTAEEHEAGFVASFIMSERRVRISELLKPKRRDDLRRALPHFSWFDSRRLRRAEKSAPSILAELQAKGAGAECYLISSDADLDGRFMSLPAALDEVEGMSIPTVISCIPGKLAYYEDEWADDRYLLLKAI